MHIEEIKPHETRNIFKKNGVRVAQIAQAMDLSFPYCCQLLSGAIRCTPENNLKLKKLATSLKNGGK